MLRRVWNFIVQPTQPIEMWPSAAPPNAVAAITDAAAASANSTAVVAALPAPSLPASSITGLTEAIGLLGAVILCQSVQCALDRYARSSSAADSAAEWKANDARVQELISALDLSPHVEGGFYRRIYEAPWILRGSVCIERAAGEAAASPSSASTHTASSSALSPAGSAPTASASALPMHFPRALSSCIYFLLSSSSGPRSHFHRLPHAEELWMHIEGDPIIIAQIDEHTGEYSERILGPVCLQSTREAMAGRGANLFVQPSSTAPTIDHLAAFSSPVDALQLYHAATFLPPASSSSLSFSSLSWPTHVVRPGSWFGARLAAPPSPSSSSALSSSSSSSASPLVRQGYSLVCCSVTPAFQFEDFELMQPDEMARLKVITQMQHRMEQQQQQQQQQQAASADGSAAADSWSEEQRQALLAEVERMVLRGQAISPAASSATASI